MKLYLRKRVCILVREPSDPPLKRGGFCAGHAPESRLLHWLKLALRARGYDVIKKRMWRDGHLFGQTETQYVRARDGAWCIYDTAYAVRNAAEDFERDGRVVLAVRYLGSKS